MANTDGQRDLAKQMADTLGQEFPPVGARPTRIDILKALNDCGLMLAKPHGRNPAEIAYRDELTR